MKRSIIIASVVLLLLGLVWMTQAKLLSLSQPRWSVGGGGVTTGSGYKISSIAGQPIVGSQSGNDYHLQWGYWQSTVQGGTVYLPIVVKPEPLPACFPGPTEEEPNNNQVSANGPVCSGQSYSGQPNDNWDYFTFDSGNGNVHVSLTTPAGHEPQVYLLDASGSPILPFLFEPPYQINFTVSAGKYYVAIYTPTAQQNSSSSYSLVITYP